MSVIVDRDRRGCSVRGPYYSRKKSLSWRQIYCLHSFVLFGLWHNLHNSARKAGNLKPPNQEVLLSYKWFSCVD